MSINLTSGRHRARLLERMRRRVLRAVRATLRRPRAAVRPRAGAAYERVLLTPRPVHVEHLPAARIGCYAAPYAAAAPRAWDEVRLLPRPGVPGLSGRAGTVLAVTGGSVLPVVVLVAGAGVVYRDAYELELLGRPAERTLTMPAVTELDADDVPLMGRAW